MDANKVGKVDKICLSEMRRRLLESAPIENIPNFKVDARMLELARAIGRQMADSDLKKVEPEKKKEYTD